MSASRCSVAHNYFRSSLRGLFTAFLETKTQLWKLKSTISGCCIGSSGSPLHPPLTLYAGYFIKYTFHRPDHRPTNSITTDRFYFKELINENYCLIKCKHDWENVKLASIYLNKMNNILSLYN